MGFQCTGRIDVFHENRITRRAHCPTFFRFIQPIEMWVLEREGHRREAELLRLRIVIEISVLGNVTWRVRLQPRAPPFTVTRNTLSMVFPSLDWDVRKCKAWVFVLHLPMLDGTFVFGGREEVGIVPNWRKLCWGGEKKPLV